ncbi:MAG: hypothetical protein JO193_05860 [Candidatus Eremiobacteraeota bacterium]|nr:hypothetical protein [Candidatus Eremiobacteraeota bacterium]
MKRALAAGAAAFVVIIATSHLRSTPYNNYVLLANALLHGHVWIDWPGQYIDALAYGGRHYVIEAPFPALPLLPLVAVFGTHANQTLVAAVLGGIAIFAAWRMCDHLGVALESTVWLCAFLLAGTDVLWCAMLGDVWFIAHVSAVAFTMLALLECLGRKRGWIVAICAACAFESRFSLVLALPVYAWLLYDGTANARVRRASVAGFCAVLLVVGLLWIGYNEARWGTPTDIGYITWYHADNAGSPTGSPFQLRYLPYELHSFFIALPHFTSQSPFVTADLSGIALTWTSPALLLALAGRRPRNIVLAMWIAAVLTAIPNFLYYVNGYAQFGMRHALDFEPFLFVLMALASRGVVPVWGKALIAYSVLVGVWGCVYWNHFMRPTY